MVDDARDDAAGRTAEPVEPGTHPAQDASPGEAMSSATAAAPGAPGGSMWARRRQRRATRKQAPKRKAPWWELPALVLLAILIAVVVKTFVVQPFYIPSQSMENTLHGCPGCRGDRILVNKPIFDFRDPEPGDIVVFDAPTGWEDEAVSKPPSNPLLRAVRGFGQLVGFVPPDGQVLVKRVIAIGGQTVKGDTDGHVMVSTKGAGGPFHTLKEPYVLIDDQANITAFGPVTIPKGRLWVMGDHRNDSFDSRFHCGPGATTGDQSACQSYAREATVPIGNVIGKAFVIAWPPSRWRTLGTPSTFDQAAGAGATLIRGGGPGAVGVAVAVPVFLRRRRRRPRNVP